MTALAYTVIATLPDEAVAREYVGWLLGGHVREVVRHGAMSARVVRVTDPPVPIQVESRYVFPSAGVYERYVATAAPALRAEGLARFGPERGVSFARRVGMVVGEEGGGEGSEPGRGPGPYGDLQAG